MQSNFSEHLLHLQNDILEAVARGEPLEQTASLLCQRAEDLAPDSICSILRVDDAGILHPLAGTQLPAQYLAAIEGLPIGAKAGSCGTAAFRGETVIVNDIVNDPLWEDYRELALPLGLASCWSSPIKARDGRVVGTFAFYHRTPLGPTAIEERIVEIGTHLCAIAIEQFEVQEHNYRLAYYDPLTGLANRSQFNERLADNISQNGQFGLLLFDVDHLKSINDTIGHAFGDYFLQTLAQRLQTLGATMNLFRLSGDEFAILVDDCATAPALASAAEQVLARVSGLVEQDGHSAALQITIGGVLYDADSLDAEAMRQNADFAHHHAKTMKRGGYLQFEQGLRTDMIERINTIRCVDKALTERRIVPHYQPLIDLNTGLIVGLEALARLRSEDGELLNAAQFHTAFSDPKIAHALTGQMLETIAEDLQYWLKSGIKLQHVGLNVTTGDFLHGDLVPRLVDTFERINVPLRHLVLEVNEAVYMGDANSTIAARIKALRDEGVVMALDDFGTGFASLTHLLSFPVDIIKIDKSFIDQLNSDTSSAAIVSAIIDIARKLNMKVVAEGVETAIQANYLADLGCQMGQGYLFSRPCGIEATTALLKKFCAGASTPPASLMDLRIAG